MRCALRNAVTLLALAGSVGLPRAQDAAEPASLLAAARKALGGDAALSAVTAFTINGSMAPSTQSVSGGSLTWEVRCILPDKFVQTTQQEVVTDRVAETVGFNAADPIRETYAGSFNTAGFQLDPPKTPDEKIARRKEQTLNGKRLLTELTFPLFAASFAAYPLEIIDVGRAKIGDRQLDVVNAKDADGQPWRLLLDGATHLPTLLIWHARPMAARRVGGSIVIGGPVENMEPVEWKLELSDYAVSNGLNWPRKLKASFADAYAAYLLDIKLTRFTLNPKIDPKSFTPSK